MQYSLGNILKGGLVNVKIDPSTLSGLVAGYRVGDTIRTGSAIDTWSDISGNGYNATAVSTKDTVFLDGAEEYASGGSRYLCSSPIPATFANMTILCIFGAGRVNARNGISSNTFALTNPASTGGGVLFNTGSAQFYNPVRLIGCVRNQNGKNAISLRYGSSSRVRSNGILNSGAANSSASTIQFDNIWGYAGAGGFEWYPERVALYIYNRELTESELKGIDSFYSVKKSASALHVIADSFGDGVGATTAQNSYVRKLELAINKNLVCTSSSGATWATFSTSALSTALLSSVNAGLNPIAVLDLGKNNLAANMSVATMQTNFTTFANAITATTSKLVAVTIPPRNASFSGGATSATYESNRIVYNAWLKTQEGVLFDKIADTTANADLENINSSSYVFDQIHLSDIGHQEWANLIESSILLL